MTFVAPLVSERGGRAALRAALVAGVALAVLAGVTGSAEAASGWGFAGSYGWYGSPWDVPARRLRTAPPKREPVKRERGEPKQEAGFGEMPKGPLQIVVSIDTQKVTLFSNGVRVAQGPVSTGVPGHPTPTGVFSVIEKDRYHRSNLYSSAPMPFMQRITWSGVALHEGVLPGYPASHGCIRMSQDFARKLWPVTKLGVRVVVSRAELAPVEFEHAKLFAPKLKPGEPEVAMNATTDGRSTARRITLAQAATPDVGSDAAAAGPQAPSTELVPDVSENRSAESAMPPTQTAPQVDEAVTAESTRAAVTTEETPEASGAAGGLRAADSAESPAPTGPRQPVETSTADETAAPVQITPAAAQPGQTATAPGDGDVGKPAPTVDPPKPVAPRLRAADQPIKRNGQVAVFVSRKEGRIFVRQGFVPLFDMPIVIEEPDRPLGTHVFTAMGLTEDGAGMRWNLMTVSNNPSPSVAPRDSRKKFQEPSTPVVRLKPPSTAAEALNRIQFPEQAVDRIGELLVPGSSLVVSDEGLGRETGRYTEFIVLTR